MPDALAGTAVSWQIYALTDPRTDDVRYVGKTANFPLRMQGHLYDQAGTRKARWIRLLRREGLKPGILILEQGDGDWELAERRWIAQYRAAGADLTNATDGGEGLVGATAETRRKIGEAQRARWTGEARIRSLALVRAPEHRAAISAGTRGKPKTAAHLAKMPQNQVGYNWSPEIRERRRQIMLTIASPAAAATPPSEAKKAHVRKLIEANRGKPGWAKGRVLSAEEREVRSAALRGRPKTPEHREKIRQAALRRWARTRGETG